MCEISPTVRRLTQNSRAEKPRVCIPNMRRFVWCNTLLYLSASPLPLTATHHSSKQTISLILGPCSRQERRGKKRRNGRCGVGARWDRDKWRCSELACFIAWERRHLPNTLPSFLPEWLFFAFLPKWCCSQIKGKIAESTVFLYAVRSKNFPFPITSFMKEDYTSASGVHMLLL
jgi:hypothetical protein